MAKAAKDKDKELGFEETLSSLEQIVAQLESGELPLERALELFEQGVGLARNCQTQLEEAERKVELLLRERGEIKVVPFEPKMEAVSNEVATTVSSPITAAPPARVNDFDEDIPF
jgi:exodeoxyribonuclease VII small subunit